MTQCSSNKCERRADYVAWEARSQEPRELCMACFEKFYRGTLSRGCGVVFHTIERPAPMVRRAAAKAGEVG